jgi:hypothetical protein
MMLLIENLRSSPGMTGRDWHHWHNKINHRLTIIARVDRSARDPVSLIRSAGDRADVCLAAHNDLSA